MQGSDAHRSEERRSRRCVLAGLWMFERTADALSISGPLSMFAIQDGDPACSEGLPVGVSTGCPSESTIGLFGLNNLMVTGFAGGVKHRIVGLDGGG